MSTLHRFANKFLDSPATVTTHDHLVMLDRDLCSKQSALRRAKHRWIVYDVSESCFGEWWSYSSEAKAELITAQGVGAFSSTR